MNFLALGVDHRSAPTAIREALAFEGARLAQGLQELHAQSPGCELVILSTCNRVELYLAASDASQLPQIDELAGQLTSFHCVPHETITSHLVTHHDEAVIGHLFRVASSLESLVLGEGQILGQVRDAYRAAREHNTVGPLFHNVFQHALRVGKRVREATGMHQGRLSIASVAVELARSVFDSFRDKTILVIGAGKMADLTLQHLATLQPGRVLVTNRSLDRAQTAAARAAAQAVPFDRLDDALAEADLVVSTTAASQPIVSYDQYARLQRRQRGGRLALILDIAVPRDFDPRIGDLDQVLLYNVDDLRAQVERNLRSRQSQIEPAQAIVDEETTACLANLRHQWHAGLVLRELDDYGDAVAERELKRFLRSCPELTETQREAAVHLVHRLKNQFLHHPRSAVREASSDPTRAHPLLAAVRQLFGLEHSAHQPRHERETRVENTS
jgi:glutamyl-tRNA reductase